MDFISPIGLHYLSAAVTIAASAFGVGIALSVGAGGMLRGIVRQQWAAPEVSQTAFFGTLFIEGSLILAFIVSIVTLFMPPEEITFATSLAELGGAIAVGIASACVSLAAGSAVRGASYSVSRQPFDSKKIQMFMLILMTLIETPAFFAFIIWIFIRTKINIDLEIVDGVRLCASGLAMGLGSIGPSIGQFLFVRRATRAVGLNTETYGKIFTISMMTEAMIETPVLFSFIISIIMILKTTSPIITPETSVIFLAVAWTIGVGTFGASIGVGLVGGSAAIQTALKPKSYSAIFNMTLISQALIETSGLFALIISFLILTKFTI
jgi:F-type H+-transporting ATPase subunit c